MSRDERQRALVSKLIMLNFIGVVAAGPYVGIVVKEHQMPWIAVAAVVVLFMGIIVPIYRLFNRMRSDFDVVQDDAYKMLRRGDAAPGTQEVFGNVPPPRRFRNAASQPLVALLITVTGWGLLIYDVIRFLFFRA